MTQASAGETPRVVLVLSEHAPVYQAVSDAFVTALGGRYAVETVLAGGQGDNEINALQAERTLIVPVGMRAMRSVYETWDERASVLALMVPANVTSIGSGARGRESAVYIDQPAGRYLTFTRRLLPAARRIGVIVSGEAATGIRELAAEAGKSGFELVIESVGQQGDVPKSVQNLLSRVDALLLMPDSIVNEQTVRYILIASYRKRIPVIGFSRSLSAAGAAASLVSAPQDIGRQGGLMARKWDPETGALPPPRHAEVFEMHFNHKVARSLEVNAPDGAQEEAALRARLP